MTAPLSVRATCPARIDLAGGWSDTPPICYALGGTVLNVAIDLDGAPVQEVRATRAEGMTAAIFAEAGCFPVSLRAHSRVPDGCGLGMSSLAAAASLACLNTLQGKAYTWEMLCAATLRVEAMLGGGGWQDQVGGLLPGVKLLYTEPMTSQIPTVETLELVPDVLAGFHERLVLFYTGQARYAGNIVADVRARWESEREECERILDGLKWNAERIAMELPKGDFLQVGWHINRAAIMNAELSPTTTMPELEALRTSIAPHVYGSKLAGAGGGGFLICLAQDGDHAAQLKTLLPSLCPAGRIYEARVATTGLSVTEESQ